MRQLFTFIGICLGFCMMLVTVVFVSFAILMFLMGPNDFLRDLEHGHAEIPILVTFGVVFLMFSAFYRATMSMFRGRVDHVTQPKQVEADLDETRMIQEMHASVMKFEQRIEALETIMLEREHASRF